MFRPTYDFKIFEMVFLSFFYVFLFILIIQGVISTDGCLMWILLSDYFIVINLKCLLFIHLSKEKDITEQNKSETLRSKKFKTTHLYFVLNKVFKNTSIQIQKFTNENGEIKREWCDLPLKNTCKMQDFKKLC